jgi:hypothetical protein
MPQERTKVGKGLCPELDQVVPLAEPPRRMNLDVVASEVAATGLALRGGFEPTREDQLPPIPGKGPGRTLLMLGVVGPGAWHAFAASPESRAPKNPFDTWTRRIVTDLAEKFGALPLFPFDGPPYWPFQRWAMRAESVAPSPIGILIHPDYGLWHAYRAALFFAEQMDLPPREARARPCDTCADRPCLTACPVGAFTESSYRVESCVRHISSPEGAMCMGEGCRARDACPVGRVFRYPAEQIRFHMGAFRRANQRVPAGESGSE